MRKEHPSPLTSRLYSRIRLPRARCDSCQVGYWFPHGFTTAGGLTFIGGTMDRRFRAFGTETGKALWSNKLPASAHATPMTFQFKGRQYVVIAASGHAKITEERQGDAILAFALPKK
jgi:glucose dehydrogenase